MCLVMANICCKMRSCWCLKQIKSTILAKKRMLVAVCLFGRALFGPALADGFGNLFAVPAGVGTEKADNAYPTQAPGARMFIDRFAGIRVGQGFKKVAPLGPNLAPARAGFLKSGVFR